MIEHLITKNVNDGKNHESSMIFHFIFIKYIKDNYFGYRARYPARFWNNTTLALTDNYQFPTNEIKKLNRALKLVLGLGYVHMERLDFEMTRFHSVKVNQAIDGLENGRMNSKRRETILRGTNVFDKLTKYEA